MQSTYISWESVVLESHCTGTSLPCFKTGLQWLYLLSLILFTAWAATNWVTKTWLASELFEWCTRNVRKGLNIEILQSCFWLYLHINCWNVRISFACLKSRHIYSVLVRVKITSLSLSLQSLHGHATQHWSRVSLMFTFIHLLGGSISE